MLKIFISVPMRGRKWSEVVDSIQQLKELASYNHGGEPVEVVSAEVKMPHTADVKENLTGLWYLGESLKLLAKADYLIGVTQAEDYGFYGCEMEIQAARYYGIPFDLVPIKEVCKDLK